MREKGITYILYGAGSSLDTTRLFGNLNSSSQTTAAPFFMPLTNNQDQECLSFLAAQLVLAVRVNILQLID